MPPCLGQRQTTALLKHLPQILCHLWMKYARHACDCLSTYPRKLEHSGVRSSPRPLLKQCTQTQFRHGLNCLCLQNVFFSHHLAKGGPTNTPQWPSSSPDWNAGCRGNARSCGQTDQQPGKDAATHEGLIPAAKMTLNEGNRDAWNWQLMDSLRRQLKP